MEKKCANPDCGWKDMDKFYSDRTRHDRKCQYCKSCFNARRKQRYKKNPEKELARSKEYYRQVKREVMDAYGGVCQCCGESELAFLTLDHIEQNGADHRREIDPHSTCTGFNFYLRLRQEGWPDWGLQVLCANCNMAKGAYGICPHQESKECQSESQTDVVAAAKRCTKTAAAKARRKSSSQ